MTDSMRVSVIIPVHNGDRYLAAAIESVLAQTHAAFEIIVVNDGSTDASADVARRTSDKVRVLSQNQSGAATARNHGIREAKGDILAFLDADDLWSTTKLQCQLEALQNEPSLDGVYTMIDHFVSPELTEDRKRRILCPDKPLPAPIATTICVRSASFHRIGFFRPDLRVGEFVDWFARAMEHPLHFFMIPQVMAHRRLHDRNIGVTDRSSRADFARIIKASLDRRREKGELIP